MKSDFAVVKRHVNFFFLLIGLYLYFLPNLLAPRYPFVCINSQLFCMSRPWNIVKTNVLRFKTHGSCGM